jgi:hypothetical protein
MPVNSAITEKPGEFTGLTASQRAQFYSQQQQQGSTLVQDDVTEAPLVTPTGNENRVEQVRSDAERIATLEQQIQEMRQQLLATQPKAPHGYLSNGDPVPSATHPYENPRDYPFALMLSTGEIVGAPNNQSTSHWSRILRQDVPVNGAVAIQEED